MQFSYAADIDEDFKLVRIVRIEMLVRPKSRRGLRSETMKKVSRLWTTIVLSGLISCQTAVDDETGNYGEGTSLDSDEGTPLDSDGGTSLDSDGGTPVECEDATPWDGDDGTTWDGTEWSAATLEQLRTELAAQIPTREEATDETLQAFLASDALDAKFARFVVLQEATPEGLEAFTQQGNRQAFLVAKMLGETGLMTQMLVADGAKAEEQKDGFGPAQYGPAIEIYAAIQKASCNRAATGVLQRLALAISLEHAIPIAQENPEAETDGPKTVDPVKRYLHYEKAFLDGELDPAFNLLSTWDLRFVVYGDEPDDILAWGRETLRNYRPDHIQTEDYAWRYVGIVKSDVRYGSEYVKDDWPELQKYQNMLMNGGVCGRRAFFGRFILRAFGIPTTARPQSGHAALVHWAPDGWVPCLGGGWGAGWTNTLYHADLDFLATTQARAHAEEFMKVKRAQWAGDVLGESRTYGENEDGTPDFWNGVALSMQRAIIDEAQAGEGDDSGEDTGNTSDEPDTAADEQITTGADGVISIPAALYSNTAGKPSGVTAMDSYDVGRQIYLPGFSPLGKTIMRGGSWKSAADEDYSGRRLLSDGYGHYEDWGLRVAMTPNTDSPPNEVTLDLGGGVTMELVYIRPGTFVMGGEQTTDEERFQCVEVPKHEVTLTRGFYLGKYEVTQAQYEAIMGSNPSESTKAPDNPVDNVGEVDAFAFAEKLAEKTQREVRLPTEAEWEYAGRAGQKTKWFFGDDPSRVGEYAWFQGNAEAKSHAVGLKKPNPWGLYDIYGNVWERISDRYSKDYYATSPKEDPTGPSVGTNSHFEYTITVPQSGKYTLTARLVTVKYEQRLNVSVNDDEPGVAMGIPFTVGSWQESEPVTLTLQKGENTLRFWRDQPPQHGMAIKSFTLKPAK